MHSKLHLSGWVYSKYCCASGQGAAAHRLWLVVLWSCVGLPALCGKATFGLVGCVCGVTIVFLAVRLACSQWAACACTGPVFVLQGSQFPSRYIYTAASGGAYTQPVHEAAAVACQARLGQTLGHAWRTRCCRRQAAWSCQAGWVIHLFLHQHDVGSKHTSVIRWQCASLCRPIRPCWCTIVPRIRAKLPLAAMQGLQSESFAAWCAADSG
jgi:hypothetical protein